jgi:hypothetical protein
LPRPHLRDVDAVRVLLPEEDVRRVGRRPTEPARHAEEDVVEPVTVDVARGRKCGPGFQRRRGPEDLVPLRAERREVDIGRGPPAEHEVGASLDVVSCPHEDVRDAVAAGIARACDARPDPHAGFPPVDAVAG